jgi:hypothetical protein
MAKFYLQKPISTYYAFIVSSEENLFAVHNNCIKQKHSTQLEKNNVTKLWRLVVEFVVYFLNARAMK